MATDPEIPQDIAARDEIFDIDTHLDLGLLSCQTCYATTPSFVSKHSTVPYFTEKISVEVRTIIIEYALLARGGNQPIKADYITWRSPAYDEGGRIHSGNVPDNATIAAYNTFLNLSKTSRLLNNEANAIFFGKNRFSFHGTTGMRVYLDNISLRQRQLIHEVIFVYDDAIHLGDLLWALDLLSQSPLRKLTMGLAGEKNFEEDSELRFPIELCVLVEHGYLSAWTNFPFKLVQTDNWIEEDLDWCPAPIVRGSEKQRLMELASNILSRKISVAGVHGAEGEALHRGEQTILNIIRHIESQQPGGLKDIAVRALQRQRGWESEIINGSQYDRLGGSTICQACFRKSQKAQKGQIAKKSRKKRLPTKKSEKKKKDAALVGEQSGRTMLGDVQNITRKPPGRGAKKVSKS